MDAGHQLTEREETMGHIKEYRGEKVAAVLTARLVPPSAQYPDCFCKLILTVRYLYILEDNFDGTYNVHFTFFIKRIRNMEAQVKGLRYKRSALGEMFLWGILSLFGGIIYASGKKKEYDGVRFVITYDDGMGNLNQLYFKDLQSNSNSMVKAYGELKKKQDGIC